MSGLSDIQAMKALKQLKNLAKDQLSPNLFNPNTVLSGQSLNNGVPFANASYFVSDFIPVTNPSQLFVSNIRGYGFYDSNKNLIAGSGDNIFGDRVNAVISVFEFSNIAYFRFNALLTFLPNVFVYKVPVQMQSPWLGKHVLQLGDSITAQAQWQPFLKRWLGLYYAGQNFGVGGTLVTDMTGSDTTAMCRDERINVMTSTGDLITFMGGANDWSHNAPIGTIADTGTNTFYGAVKTVAQKLTSKYPTNPIIFMGTPFGLNPNKTGWADTSGAINNLGYNLGDYGRVVGEVARMYSFPFVDFYNTVGWNSGNITNYVTVDDPNTIIHPNATGGEVMAGKLIGLIKSLNWNI